MRVLIVEDESPTAQRLVHMLERYDASVEVLGCFSSVEKTLAYFAKPDCTAPDLLFLDIHLDDDLGFSILEKLDFPMPVIFTTAYSEYSLKAFKSFSIDYLLKPVDYEELCAAMDKYKKVTSYQKSEPAYPKEQQIAPTGYKDRFMVAVGSRLLSIPTEQIAYFSYEQKATFLITVDSRHYALDYSLSALIELLDPRQFFRVNRSVIVSMNAVRSVFTYSTGKLKVDLQPAFKDELFVSLDRIVSFKYWLGK